jgi:hypothetical protein
MKVLLKMLAHAALGGAAVAAAQITAGTPIRVNTLLYPILASALTSILSLFAKSPAQN